MIRRMLWRLRHRSPSPSMLIHEEVARLLVDYHFGRLSAEKSAAVEAHVRSCATCQREGLAHAHAERRVALRRLDHIRAARPHAPRKRKPWLVVALLVALVALGVGVLGSGALGVSWFHQASQSSVAPTPLVSKMSLALRTVGAAAVAGDPSGRRIAVVTSSAATSGKAQTSSITLWGASDGQLTQALNWPGSGVPTILAWSPNGHILAASDGALIALWAVGDAAPRVIAHLPSGITAAIFSSASGQLVARPDLARQLARNAFAQWSADGDLAPAPVGAAAPLGVAPQGGPLVGMWRMSGTYLFAQGHGSVAIGAAGSSAGAGRHAAGFLDWSPDGRFLLWSSLPQPAALPEHNGTQASVGAPPPDATLAALVGQLASVGRGDGLAWFAPDGGAVALCDRSAAGAALEVVDLTRSAVAYALPGACDRLALASVSWLSDSTALIIALPGAPVREYPAKVAGQ